MSKKNIDLTKDPELFIDGEKIKFHTSRTERLAMMRNKTNRGTGGSFFGKENRHWHIIILNIILLFSFAVFYTSLAGGIKSAEFSGFKYILAKKNSNSKVNLSFTIQIKNVLKNDNVLKEKEINFKIINEKQEAVYNNDFIINKTNFKPDEFYMENFIVERPAKGKYKSILKINNEKSIEALFNIQ